MAPVRADAPADSDNDGAGGACVITPTARLARELRRQFDRRQRDRGLRAWESADVLPFDAFAQRLWHARRALLPQPPLLLNAWQLRAIWENIIGDDIRGREAPLWNTHATARLAVGAWQLAQEWRISPDACADSPHEDHRRWARWARRYQKRCAERNWVDAHCIKARLAAMLRADGADGMDGVGAKITAVGFDQLLPQQQALLDALRAAGAEVEIKTGAPAPVDAAAPPEIRVCENPASEWLQAACWARDKLRAAPDARIAIVAPNLERDARAVEYACKQILCPRKMLAPGLRAELPYHIALGAPLGEYPVADAALAALAPFAGAPLPAEDVGRLLRSPFLRGADSESDARGALERHCRQKLPYQTRFKTLRKEIAAQDARAPRCRILLEMFRKAEPLLQDINKEQPAGRWARVFTDWLLCLGWPGERALDSDEHQAARAFRRELRNLASLETTAAPMRAAAALAWLRRRLAEQPFQVEAHDAPVQVLGVREAAGQHFDALWFGGLVEADWPPPRRPNPFIAARVQRHAGVANASVEGARAQAALQQSRLLASADEAVLSRPRASDDIVNEPSALLDEAPGAARARADERAVFDTPANILHAHKPELETFTDARAPAFAPDAAAGGVSVIEDQAKCPFRAFAVHRLGARAREENEQGLDAAKRGSLMHRALQSLWKQIGTSKKLRALSDEKLREIVDAAAAEAGKRYHFSSGCGARFLQLQKKWAADTLLEWLENEKRRAAPFCARQLEEKTDLNLGGLALSFQIDRIDQLEDDGIVLIDYKTGKSAEAGQWLGARPRAPQLPLYALAQHAPPAALAFGRVRRGECAFVGVSGDAFIKEPDAQNKITPFEKNRKLKNEFADFDALLAHWRAALQNLAREFLDGEARVDPQPQACDHCGLHGLCRIDS